MSNETQVSGAIFANKDRSVKDGETYTVKHKANTSNGFGGGWGLPVEDLEPNDLRVLADRIEAIRTKNLTEE